MNAPQPRVAMSPQGAPQTVAVAQPGPQPAAPGSAVASSKRKPALIAITALVVLGGIGYGIYYARGELAALTSRPTTPTCRRTSCR